MPPEWDVAVVGGGILGVAVARELATRRPRARVVLLEREPELGAHQTSHNSGVIHAGIYYRPGSLKARLCVAGARALYELCQRRGVLHERCGKVIVAREHSELPRLDELERRGRANGVPGLRRLGSAELTDIEPHCRGLAALHSPATGIVDFAAVTRALADEARERGAKVRTGWPVTSVGGAPGRVELGHAGGALTARFAVFCAGAFADRLAVADGAPADPRIVPFRGAYLRLRRPELVRAMIYPVPDPRLPFLGVHLSRHLGGEVSLGPTALLVGARDAYALRQVRSRDLASTLAWPGTWRLMRRFWRTGVSEIAHTASRRALARAAASYVPDIKGGDLEPWFAGVRAQAVSKGGRLLDDFVVSRTERALHVRNAPSPAATSALALAAMIADEVEDEP